MKLHLPKQLFTALLSSCVTLVPMAVTFASGALVFAGSVAMAADQQLTSSETWDGTTTTTASADGTISVGDRSSNCDITLTITDGAEIEADWMELRSGADVLMTGGQVTLNKLHIHNYNKGGQTEEFVVSGGVLTVNNGNDFNASGTGDKTPVTIGHWGNGGGKLVVSGGKLQVVNGSVYMGHDSYATLQITDGEANIAGLYYNKDGRVGSSLELSGGRLNIGSEGIRNTNHADIRKVSFIGGILGALADWTLSGVTTTIGTVTIDTDKWDAATGATASGENAGGVNISLLGNLLAAEGGMAITLAGSGSLTIDHTLNGTVTLAKGATAKLIADITNLTDNYSKVYSGYGSTNASGFWFGYKIVEGGSNVTVVDTQGNNLNLSNGVYGVASDGIFYVNDEVTYDAAIMGTATKFNIESSGVLNVDAGTVSGCESIDNKGELRVAAGSAAVELKSFFYNSADGTPLITNSASAVTEITTTGAANVGDSNLSLSGEVQINNAASFTNNGKKISGGKLILSGVNEASWSGGTTLATNLELINTTLTMGASDAVDYSNGSNLTIKIGQGSELKLGTNRQSLRSNHVFEMAGGRITGTGNTADGYLLGLDFYSGGRINTTADSSIDTNVGGHLNGTLEFNVSNNVTLTLTGNLVSKGQYKKSNSGTLLYKGGAFARTLTISGGAFEYYTESDLTHDGTIEGTGTFSKSGSGVMTLNSSGTSVTTLNVASGKLIYNSTTERTHTLTGVGGTTFEKTGDGTLIANTAGFNGDILVSSGTWKNGAESAKNQKVTVAGDATLDLNGNAAYYNLTLQRGAVLTNSVTEGSVTSTSKMQLNTITLQGDAKVNGASEFGMVGNQFAATNLHLNGNTFTKEGDNVFHMVNTTVQSAGVLEVKAGQVQAVSRGNGALNLQNLSLLIDGGDFALVKHDNTTVGAADQSIQALTLKSGSLSIGSDYTLTVLGDTKLEGGSISGALTLAGSLTVSGAVDMSAASLSVLSFDSLSFEAETQPETSGLQSLTYNLWEGNGSITGLGQVTVGAKAYTVTGGKITTASSVYYVATNDTKIAGGNSGYDEDTGSASAFVVDGTLELAGNTEKLTVNGVLSNASGTGTICITTSGLDTHQGGTDANYSLTTRFSGTLELASGVSFTLGRNGSETDAAVIKMDSLSALVLNNGSTLRYNANGKTNIANVHIVAKANANSSAAGIYYVDSVAANSLQLTGVTRLDGDLNISSQWDGGINIHKLVGGGSLNGSSGTGVFNTSIGALFAEVDGSINTFTGNLTFSGGENKVSISTGAGYDGTLTFGNLTANGVNSFSFNVQSDTSVAAMSTNRGSVSVSNGVTLTFRESSSVQNLSASEGVVSVASGKLLTLSGTTNTIGTVNAQGNLNVSANSSLSLAGGSADALKIHKINMLTAVGAQSNIEIGENAQLTLTDYLDLSKGGAASGLMTVGADSTVKVSNNLWMSGNYSILLNEDAQLQFGAVVVSGKAGGESYIRSEAAPSVSNSDWYTVGNGHYQMDSVEMAVNSSEDITLDNKLTDSSLENKGAGQLTVGNSANTITGLAATNGNVKLSASMDVDSISAKAGKVVTVTNGNTIRMEGGVDISANGADATMTAKTNSALARLQEDASFTIADMTLTNTSITAATVNTRVELKNVSGDVALKTGIFGVEMTTVGMGGSALSYTEGAPSITLSSTDAGAARLMISANPTVDVRGSYGTYTLTFNLNLQLDSSLGEPASNEAWGELVGFSGWLGTMLEEQGAVFAGAAGDPVAQSTAPSVSYGYSAGSGGSNVGTLVITINGLNVPEPTTSTLSLLALAGLCARRRRR